MSLRLGFDVDGVLADFRSAFQEAATRILGRSAVGQSSSAALDPEALSPQDAKQVWRVLTDTPNWWLSVPPYEPVQIARLYQLARRFKWEVIFLTMRTRTAGDSAQLQTQTWLEAHGFYMPSVVTMAGSRGELANASRLDLVVDDQLVNLVEVVGASQSKAVLLLRAPDSALEQQATARGIGVVNTLEEAIAALLHLNEILPQKQSRLVRLTDWFTRRSSEGHVLPMNPRASRPIPPPDDDRR